MDKKKYLSKVLIAQYEYLGETEEGSFIELVYRLKNGSIIIEYSGGKHSFYGVMVGFHKYIPRRGIYEITEFEYRVWKLLREDSESSRFINWEEQYSEQLYEDHETVLKCVSVNDLPF